ncbi:MAG TPA: hypothetical protein PKI03_07980 [Pseudomonadota bacterium]|nr:hypothetical protein [Pseudomonadota bacterium]
MRGELATERSRREQLEELVGQLGCSDSVRETQKNLQEACSRHRDEGGAAGGSQVCKSDAADQEINRLGTNAKTAKRKYFDDLTTLRHIVVYFAEGASGLEPKRRKQLDVFMHLRQLARTRFVLATSDKPSTQEAKRRLDVLRAQLQPYMREGKLEDNDIIYDYFGDVAPKDLRLEDRPISNSSESNLSPRHSVWVYRLDCL